MVTRISNCVILSQLVILLLMNVTLQSNPGQARASRRAGRIVINLLAAGFCGLLLAAGVARSETVTNLKAVNTSGVSTWTGSFPITLVGVLLTDPSEMLDSTPDFIPWNFGAGIFQLGGQWQVFVQTINCGDHGGVECWMGQNYGNLPWEANSDRSYSNPAWSAEVTRVSHDLASGYAFHKGDLVMVTANGSLFYGGQQNINEEHSIDPAYDFTISLVSSNFGLLAPAVIALASVIRTNLGPTGHYDIFDPTRATGGERYQGMRERINGLTLATTSGWNTNSGWGSRFCTATDGEGRQLPLIHPLYDLGTAPTGQFDATGVFIQESGSSSDGTFGYELFVQEITPSSSAMLNLANKPVITWPAALANYQVQSSDSLSSSHWTAVTNAPVLANGKNTVVLEPTGAQKFFRLQRVQ